MRIVHLSDWHGAYVDLPPADLYVCSGDMLPNFPITDRDYGLRLFRIDRSHEERTQTKWMDNPKNRMRHRLGSPDSPVVCVRGNHDFVPIAPIFAGCDVTELVDNEAFEIAGKRVTGHRGIPWIHGTWNDEVQRPDLIDRMKAMPPADIYVTHYPPWGILDYEGAPGREERYGLEEMAFRLVYSLGTDEADDLLPPKSLHLFGHIHGCGGRTERNGSVLFSNAATKFNVIEF